MTERPILARYLCPGCMRQISKWNKNRICLYCQANPPSKIGGNVEARKKDEWRRGSNHSSWKGDKVSYPALHSWIRRELGTATYCANDDSHKTRIYEWANISGEYKRDINDYKPLCTSCHRKYDMTDAKREATSKRHKGKVYHDGRKKAVYQYTIDSTLIKKYESLGAAFKETGVPVSTIANNLRGFRQSGGGYLWKYAKEVEGYEEPIGTVYKYTLDGEFVEEYKTMADAARAMALSESSVHNALRGKTKSSGGYLWRYADNSILPDEIRQKNEKYGKEHFQKNKQRIYEYRRGRKEELAAWRKEYYKQNREKILERRRTNYLQQKQLVVEISTVSGGQVNL